MSKDISVPASSVSSASEAVGQYLRNVASGNVTDLKHQNNIENYSILAWTANKVMHNEIPSISVAN